MALSKVGKNQVDQSASLTVDGDLTVDTNTLYVDSTNNRVGIGTSSPSVALDIEASGWAGVDLNGTSGGEIRLQRNNVVYGNIYASDNTALVLDSASSNEIVFMDSGTERMRIDSSGNVSLGNGKFLQFKDSGGTARDVITIDAYNGLNINSAGGGSAAPIVFKSNNAETMRIDSSGNLLVGCTSLPSASVPGLGVDLSNASELRCSHFSTGNSTQIRFLNPNGEVGSIRTNGSGTNFNTSSDYRLKENVVADWDATTRLKQLNPVRFNFISDADTTVDGFLAHEVQTVVPEAISGTKDAVDDDGNPIYQGIDQSKLVPLLVKTIQELEARIAALETA